MNIAEETISIPVEYLEAFIMMLGAYLIGYIGCYVYYNAKLKKHHISSLEKEKSLRDRIKFLQDEVDLNEKYTYKKDRMDQDIDQVQFHERAFSDDILSGNVNKSQEINFDVIGYATEENKDNLQEINGIGPYTEAKLNHLGIFTFEQISKFTDTEIETVTDLIKFFPGRIKNDKWVARARSLSSLKNQSNKDPDDKLSKKKMIYEKTT